MSLIWSRRFSRATAACIAVAAISYALAPISPLHPVRLEVFNDLVGGLAGEGVGHFRGQGKGGR